MLMSRMALSQLPPGRGGVVREIRCAPALEMRLEAAYEIRGAVIALRRRDAEQILVEAEP